MQLAPHQRTVVILAAAGLLPFIGMTLLALFGVELDLVRQGLSSYSLAIICFLAGSWWGFALLMPQATSQQRSIILVSSNLVVIGAVATHALLDPVYCIWALACFYPLLLVGEARLPGLQRQPGYYRQMRERVSMAAFGAHLLVGLSSVA